MNRLDHQRRKLAAGLACLAGYVDAVGFLSADSYFVSFMSGNTTRFATDLASSPIHALTPILLISGFVGGVAIGTVTANLSGHWRKPAVLSLVTLLLAIASALALQNSQTSMMIALVLAMGALNTALHSGDSPVALTYLTGALVRIGQWMGDRLSGKSSPSALPVVIVWFSLASGAVLGALVFSHEQRASLLLALLAAIALTLYGWRIARLSVKS